MIALLLMVAILVGVIVGSAVSRASGPVWISADANHCSLNNIRPHSSIFQNWDRPPNGETSPAAIVAHPFRINTDAVECDSAGRV
jgi:hypothetical protein